MKEIKWTDKTPKDLPGTYLSDSAKETIGDDDIIHFIMSDKHISTKSTIEIIGNYISDEIERFCNFNHISKRAWKKRGVITKETDMTGTLIYRLVYQSLLKNCLHEIKFGNDIF